MTDAQPPAAARAYMARVLERLERIVATQEAAIAAAASLCCAALDRDGLIYLFGTGHSHMLAEEGHYRAGGLAPVCPILASGLMLHEGAATSTRLERVIGLAPHVLARHPLGPADVLIVFSNSGVNAVPVEAARHAKARGTRVIAVLARAYAETLPVGPVGQKLAEVADLVIDNQGPPGDALLEVAGTGLATGPLSTIAGALILNAVLSEVVVRVVAPGGEAPVYVSANMPGAAAHNARLVARYQARNPHL